MPGSLNAIEITFVKPFYLKMMGLNALHLTEDLWLRLIDAGRAVSADDVRWMLRTGHWRPVVMGAWFSLAVPIESIVDDLLTAMSESKGSLTAPPLAAAATLVAGTTADTSMINYITFISDPRRRDGSESFVAAAVHQLGASPGIATSDEAHRTFRDLYAVAVHLRERGQAAATQRQRHEQPTASFLGIAQ